MRLKLVNAVLFAAGVAALVWMVARVGPGVLLDSAAEVGWAFALALGAHFLGLAVGAASLRLCVGPGAPLGFVLAANLAGHAVNEATPMAKLGEVTKLGLLAERVGGERAAAGLIVWNISLMLTGALVIAVACAAALALFPVAAAARAAVAGVGAAFAALAALSLVFLFVRVGRWPFTLLGRLGVSEARCRRWEARWLEVERHWRDVASGRGRLAAIFVLAVAIRGANLLEAAAILGALGVEPLWAASLVGLASFQLAYWLTSFVPLQVGTAEGGTYAAFALLGLSGAHGLELELARRLRRLVFIAIGLAVLGMRLVRSRRAGSRSPTGSSSR